jgi:hypothetical protein
MWSRLVALFRKQLQNGKVDPNVLLTKFYFHRRRPLGGVLTWNLEVTQTKEADKTVPFVIVKVNSHSAVKARRHQPDAYEQSIIAVFLDGDFRATVLSDTKIHGIAPNKQNKHIATFPLPAGTRTIIIAMKCNHQYQGSSCAGVPTGMSVVKVE